MASTQTERPDFYEEQYLGAEDLTAAVDYARIQQARHALGAHIWGIATGLQLKETPVPGVGVSVHVLPGFAWDGYGRPITVLSPYRIPEEMFSRFTFESALDDSGKGRLIPVWLRYEESVTPKGRAAFGICDSSDRSSRIQETFRIEIGEVSVTDRSAGITIAGKSLANPKTALKEFDPSESLVYDESIPHQELSGLRQRARWLIPLGFVRWLPVKNQPGHFVSRDDGGAEKDSDKIRRSRRYIGVVAEEIVAADGAIRLRHRGSDPATSPFKPPLKDQTDNALVSVEGNLRVEGESRVCGGGLDFRNVAGDDSGVPIWIRRSGDGVPGARAMQVAIGPKNQTTNRFAVGVVAGNDFEEKFVVLSGGKVGIGTKSPIDQLHLVGDLRVAGVTRKPGGGGWTNASDARLKKDIAQLTDALDRLLQLRGVSFEWREPEKMGNLSGPQMGLVAQEVERVFPEWVSRDSDGNRELTVRGFEALVIEALREMKAEIEELSSRLQKLEKPKPRTKQARSKKAQ